MQAPRGVERALTIIFPSSAALDIFHTAAIVMLVHAFDV